MVSFRIRFCEVPQRRCSCCTCTGTCRLRPEWQKAPGKVWLRELRSRLLDNLRNLRERCTLSSWRRTRSGIRVSLRPSTVKWFSASLRTISSIYVLFILWFNLLESSDPVFEGRILWTPGVRRGDNKNPIRGEHFLNNGSITLKFGDYVYIWTLFRLWSTLLMTFTLPLIGAAIAEDTEVCQWGYIRRSDQTSYSSAHFACGCLLGRPSGFPRPGQGFLLPIADQLAFKIVLLSPFVINWKHNKPSQFSWPTSCRQSPVSSRTPQHAWSPGRVESRYHLVHNQRPWQRQRRLQISCRLTRTPWK